MKRNYFLIFLAFFMMISFFGCNAMKGAGKDMENAGKDIQKNADQNK